VLDRLIEATFKSDRRPGLAAEVQRVVDNVALYHLTRLAVDPRTHAQARAETTAALRDLAWWLETAPVPNAAERHHREQAASLIRRFLADPNEVHIPKPADAPPGQPI